MIAIARGFLLCAVLWASGAAAQSNAVSQADARAIQSTIEAQLQAFAQDDAGAAFAFATEAIRQRFGSAEHFMKMVRLHYPAVYRPASVAFHDPEQVGGETVQVVQFTDHEFRVWLAVYRMQRQSDNSWRINGCVMQGVDGSST